MISDTPISDSTPHNVAELGMLCRRLERELNAANERIKRLEEALGCVVVDCNHLHHRKKHQHRSGEPCPVEELIRKAKEAKP
jgi:archaellum component FlaC